MIKYQEIERRLLEIEGGLFQNVCDALLYLTEEDCNNIFRPGSQTGTTKTRPGTPDTYFVLSNGQYILIEYTTQDPSKKKELIDKVRNDIDKCSDRKKTGLQIGDIDKLIYCCTGEFSSEEHKNLIDYARSRELRLDIRGLHSIARQLSGPCASTAKDYLGISIDTGQVLSPEIFVQEYEFSGLATPLTNTFMHRQTELGKLLKSIQSMTKITIITGPSGMGKSRLAMEVSHQMHITDKSLKVFCITNKNAYIHDDLRLYLAMDNPYLILVDDANRQSGHLESLLGILREKRASKIHIVITVRDYALGTVMKRCEGFNPDVIKVGYFTDVELSDILRSSDFGLKGKMLQRILAISNGNARLAIMAAKVCKESDDVSLLNDVGGIYDKYFEGAIGDGKVFLDIDILRSLGLLSFFFSIDLDDKDFISTLCDRFGIEEFKFRSSMLELERLELAESNDDLSIMKIGDQVLGTYFFYRTFIRDGVLSFRTVMEYYHKDYLGRIRDSIIPANSTFSYEKVYPKLETVLSEFWPEISKDSDQAFNFLNIFWFYRKYDLFDYVSSKVSIAPKHTKGIYAMDPKVDRYGYGRDKQLALLDNFFSLATEDIHTAIGLSLEYVRAYPDVYSQFIKTIRMEFSFKIEDADNNYFRQHALWEHILSGARKEDKLLASVFFDVAEEIMKSDSTFLRVRIDEDDIHIGTNLEKISGLISFRELSWNFIDEHFSKYPQKVESFLLSYIHNNMNHASKVYFFDLSYLKRIFEAHFDPEYFVHCYIIREMLDSFARVKIVDDSFASLKKRFNCRAYQYYLLLSWDRLRDKGMYDYEFSDHDKYTKIKEREVRRAFVFSNLEEFEEFYNELLVIYIFRSSYVRGFHHSLNIILQQILEMNVDLTVSVIEYLITRDNITSVLPLSVFHEMWKVEAFADRLYNMILNTDFNDRTRWLQHYVDLTPDVYLRDDHVKGYLELIAQTRDSMYVHTHTLKRLEVLNSNIFSEALLNIVSRPLEDEAELLLDETLFKEYITRVGDIALVKKAYLLQDRIHEYFDCKYEGMLRIIEHDPTFLMDYIRSLPMGFDGISRADHLDLNVIWKLDNAEKHIWDILDYLATNSIYSSSYANANIFFSGLTSEQNELARTFISGYLRSNAMELKKVDMVMNVARNSLTDIEANLICEWLMLNPSIEDFKRITWQSSSLSGGSGTVFNDIRANRFQKVLDAFSGLGLVAYRYIAHKSYLNERIAQYRRAAISERRRNFL
jgi:hypothetical protein